MEEAPQEEMPQEALASTHLGEVAAATTVGPPALLSDGTPDFWTSHPDDVQPTGFMEF